MMIKFGWKFFIEIKFSERILIEVSHSLELSDESNTIFSLKVVIWNRNSSIRTKQTFKIITSMKFDSALLESDYFYNTVYFLFGDVIVSVNDDSFTGFLWFYTIGTHS